MADKIRVGVIGVGFGANVQIPGFQTHPGTEVVAVCSAQLQRAHEAAQRFNIPHAFDDYRRLLELSDVDAVSIVTPPTLHHAITVAALQAAKHVLCEKPMAASLAEAQEMEEAGRRAGRVCMIDHEWRFLPGRTRMKELLDDGYIGMPRLLHQSSISGMRADPSRPWNWWSDRSQAGGYLQAQGSHVIDAARHWFGEIKSVLGQLYTDVTERPLPGSGERRRVDADDGYAVLLRFQIGAHADVIATSVANAAAGSRFEAYGSEGTLVLDNSEHLHGARAGGSLEELAMPDALLQQFGDYPHNSSLGAFIRLVDVFVRGIREGAPVAPSFSDGVKVQEVMGAVHRSHAEGRWVDLPLT